MTLSTRARTEDRDGADTAVLSFRSLVGGGVRVRQDSSGHWAMIHWGSHIGIVAELAP